MAFWNVDLFKCLQARDISVAWDFICSCGIESEKWKIGIDQNSCEVESTAGDGAKEGE